MNRVRLVVSVCAVVIVVLAVSAAVQWLPRELAAVAMLGVGAVGSMSGVAFGQPAPLMLPISDTPVV